MSAQTIDELSTEIVNNLCRLSMTHTNITSAEHDEMLGRIEQMDNAAKKRIAELEAEVYTPSTWQCKECNFQLTKSYLHVSSGNVAANQSEIVEPCPNDGLQMFRVSWKEYVSGIDFAFHELLNEKTKLEAQIKTLGRSALESIQDLSSFKSATASADKIAKLEPAAKRWEWVKNNCTYADWRTGPTTVNEPSIELAMTDEAVDGAMSEMEKEGA